MADVTFLGIGTMGEALARCAIGGGKDTVIWNRTAGRAEALASQGARYMSDVANAISESPVVIVCVDDYEATDSFLKTSAGEAALKGRSLIQLSSGSPKLARAAQDWARSIGTEYLDGAIMVFPSQIGNDEARILIGGDREAFEKSESILQLLAPATKYLGEDAGAASSLDEALLSVFLGALVGVVNGAALCEASGVSLKEYCELLDPLMPVVIGTVLQTAQKIADDELEDTEASLATWGAVLNYMSETARDAGFSEEISAFIRRLFDQAIDRGLAEHDIAALIEVLRPNT